MKSLEWQIARRYLASRRKGQFLSLITLIAAGGVILGVTALLTVIAVMTGLQQDLQAKILGSTPHVYVFEQGSSFRMEDWRPVLATAKAHEASVAAEPFVVSQVGVQTVGGEFAQFGSLYGIVIDTTVEPMTDVQRQLRSGGLAFGPTRSGRPGLLVGSRLAIRLGVLPGDLVQIIALENIRTDPFTGGLYPKVREFEVTGTFTTGMYDYDDQNMYTPIAAAQDLLALGDQVGGIAVNVREPWEADRVARSIQQGLDARYYTSDWMSLNASLFSALKLEKIAMGVILFLIVVVAAFNIISTLIMVVTDKTKEIGILKAMGMTDAGVLRVFVLQGLAVGLIGTLFGTLGGLGLIWLLDTYRFIELPGDVYFIDTLPVALELRDLLLIVLASVAVAFAATIYPARRASRLLPVDAIRHD
ncbi:MAG: FtsX-like permease family protein [Longimicrobiales bacterium]